MHSVSKTLPSWLEQVLLEPLGLEQSQQHDVELWCLLAQAEAALELYRYDTARKLAAAIADHPDRLRDDYRALILGLSARLHLFTGNIDDAFHQFNAALESSTLESTTAMLFLLWARALDIIGNTHDALDNYRATLEHISTADQTAFILIHCHLARIQRMLGDFRGAHTTLEYAAERADDAIFHAHLETERAALLVARGAASSAIEVLSSIRSATPTAIASVRAIIQDMTLLQAYLQLERWDDAGSLAEALVTRTEELHLPYHSAEACYWYGHIFSESRSGYYSPPLAIEQFKRALKHIKHVPFGWLHSAIHRELAIVYRTIGHHRNAYVHLEHYSTFTSKALSLETIHRIKEREICLAIQRAEHQVRYWKERCASLEEAIAQMQQTVDTYKQRLDEQIAYLGVVAHDLKNPIAAIMMSTSILERYHDRLSSADREKHLSNITQTAEWMKELVTSLLDFTALSTGRLKLTIEPVHCSLLMDTVIESYRLRALAKSLTIHKRYPSSDVYVLADSKRLQECLDNLLSNAIKYSPLGRSIICSIEQHQACIRFAIRDEGPGLTQEEQQKLFMEFSRARSRDTGNEGGTGLGLSIVRRFVEAMNGSIGCESAPGKGSTFFIDMPMATPKADMSAAQPQISYQVHNY